MLLAPFRIAYTVGFLLAGKFIDRFGTRIGYAAATAWWSVAAGLHALASSAVTFGFWRALLGIGEAGNFPAAIKAVAEWFPPQDRAFATGVFNSGSNLAAVAGPPALVWLNLKYGWRSCFLLTAGLGIIWVAAWLAIHREPAVEESTPQAASPHIGWMDALRSRATWGFALGKFLTDPVWWFYLFWLPPYLYDVRKFDMKEVGWALPVVYSMSGVGSIAGGWLSGFLIRRGWVTGRARRTAMAVCAFLMPIAAMSVFATGPILTIGLMGLATAAHQGLVGESLYNYVGPLPARCRSVGDGHRRLRWWTGRLSIFGDHSRIRGHALRLHADVCAQRYAACDSAVRNVCAAGEKEGHRS